MGSGAGCEPRRQVSHVLARGCRGIFGFIHSSNDGRTHDGGIGMGGDGSDMVGSRNAEADCDGKIASGTDALHRGGDVRGIRLFAGESGPGQQIDEPAAAGQQRIEPLIGGGQRNERAKARSS